MNRVKITIRLPAAQEIMLKRYGETRGMTRYEAVLRSVEAGLGVLTQPTQSLGERAELALALDELAKLSARLKWLEGLLDRTLFVASASYSYARHAALHGERDPKSTDTNISAATDAAFMRQKNLAKGSLK